MKLYHRTIKDNGHPIGVETFFKTNDKKKPTQRVAFIDFKLHSILHCGNCKCGGTIVDLNSSSSVIDYRICEKCSADHSNHSMPKLRVGTFC